MSRRTKRSMPKPTFDGAIALSPSRTGMPPSVIHTAPTARNALFPYLNFPVVDPGVFYQEYPRLLLAYSAPAQGVPLSVAAMCNEVPDLEIDVLKVTHHPNTFDAIVTELLRRRRARGNENVVFILKHTERAYRRTSWSTDSPSFFIRIHDAMAQKVGRGAHLAVACFEAVPTIIPRDIQPYVPVQVYFAPPDTEMREALFQGHIDSLRRHCVVNPKIAAWVKSVDSDESMAAYLADSSVGASVGHISDFAKRIAHEFIGLLMLPDVPASPNLEVDMDFIRLLLHDGIRLTQGDPNQAEDEFRAYAGLPQSHHMAQAAAEAPSIFATPSTDAAPKKKKRKALRMDEDE